jgi:hypothetical protein
MQQQQQQHSAVAPAAASAAAAVTVPTGNSSSSDFASSSTSSSSGSSSGKIEVLEVDHCSCVDLQVLLGAAVGSGRLTGLNTVQLNWCCMGRR